MLHTHATQPDHDMTNLPEYIQRTRAKRLALRKCGGCTSQATDTGQGCCSGHDPGDGSREQIIELVLLSK